MEHKNFLELLNKAKLNKKEFVSHTGLAYSTVVNWSGNNNIPHWVESWLENYIAKQKFENIKDILKDEL